MVKFFLFLVLSALAIGAACGMGIQYGFFQNPTFYKQSLILLTISTGLIYAYLYKAERPNYFLQLYLLTMVVKLLGYCSYLLAITLRDKTAAFANAVFFMLTYLVFTALEVAFLYRKISGNKAR